MNDDKARLARIAGPPSANVRRSRRSLDRYADWLAGIWLQSKLDCGIDWSERSDFTPEDYEAIEERIMTIAKRLQSK